MSSDPTGTEWGSVRDLDGRRCVLKIIPVEDVVAALEGAVQQIVVYGRVGNEHLVRRHSAIDIGGGSLALVSTRLSVAPWPSLLVPVASSPLARRSRSWPLC